MLIFKLCRQFNKAKPTLQQIAALAGHCPQRVEEGAAHLVSLGSSVQYCYYTLLVDAFLGGKGGMVVDWGGQYGHVTTLLQNEGYQAECYFLRPPANFDTFQRTFKFPYTCGCPSEKTKLPYKNDSALAVISSGVLEHVRESGTTETESLNEIFRIIKPGGYLFVWNLPREAGFPELIKRLIGKWHHPFKYTLTTAKQLLRTAGFEVVFSDSHEFLPIGARRIAVKMAIPPWLIFELDYLLSKIPPFSLLSQHITIVARKPQACGESQIA